MGGITSLFAEYNDYSLENLLREFLLTPDSQGASEEIVRVIKSADAFQQGRYEKNNFVAPSEAYSLVVHAINLMNSDLSIDSLLQLFLKDEELKKGHVFIECLLMVINNTVSVECDCRYQLVFWG